MKSNRLEFTSPPLFLLMLICLVSACGVKEKKAENTHEIKMASPNIVYILADDLGYGDLSFTGQEHFETPNLDRLAQKGLFFTQHYSGSTVCAPSRSALLTGQHTGHTFVRGNREVHPEGQHPLPSGIATLPKLLKGAGYVTGAFGKWGLGYPGSEGDPLEQGFDEFFGYNCQRMAHSYYPEHLWQNGDSLVIEENKLGKHLYAPNLIHEKALSFINEHKDSTFFLYYPMVIPHAELAAPEAYVEEFRGTFPDEKPYNGVSRAQQRANGGYASQKEPMATFAAMVTLLDAQVGEVIKKLEEHGIHENTLVVFTSDNGPHMEGGAEPEFFNSNGQLRGFKRDLYEGGIRVPMIAYWPEHIEEGRSSDHLSAFWDVLPTFCELAGTAPPEHLDGISFVDELLGHDQENHEYLYWEFHEQGGKQAVRYDNWKAVRLNMANNPNAPIELYDLSVDIGEENDLSDSYPSIVAKMDSIMKQEHKPSEVFGYPFESE